MKKAFDFVSSLKNSFFDFMGFPTIEFSSDVIEIYFDCKKTIRDLDIFELSGYDEFRMFSGDGCITVVFTFYRNDV